MAVHQASASPTDETSHEHLVTVYDGSFEKTFISTKTTVAAALKAEGVVLEMADRVEPAAETELIAGNYSVNVYRARPVTVVDEGKQVNVLTSAQSPKQVVKEAKSELYPEDKTKYVQSIDPLSDGGIGLKLVVERATPIELTLYGKKSTARTLEGTVGEMLSEKGIDIGPKDGMSVKPSQQIVQGMKISIWRNGKQTITEEEVIAKPIEEIHDADRKVGYREIKTPGANGTEDVTYEIVLQDGKEVSRKKISTNVTKQPIKEIVVIGTKPSFSGDFGAALAKLRSCEGGYDSWNPAGPYYGAYQFDRGTWSSVSSAPYGSASPAEQDAAARALYERRGWQPWPVCGGGLPDTFR